MDEVRVLLVDDDVEFAETLGERLEHRAFSVAIAAGGDEALEKLEREEYDVVLLDLFMPGKDGLETLREIQILKPLTKVIILSGKGTEDAAIEGMKCGAYDFLTKPPEIDEIVETILGAYAKRSEQLTRIERAQAKGSGEDDAVTGSVADAGQASIASSSEGRILVFGLESTFSDALIQYALNMAERLSYDVVALNAAGFSDHALRSFPAARERVCQGFQRASERSAVPFREASEGRGIAFRHVVKFSAQDQAIQEIKHEVGPIEFVISESAGEFVDSGSGPEILVYSPT